MASARRTHATPGGVRPDGEAGDQRAFDELCAFVTEQRFDYIGVFTYSLEEGTTAPRAWMAARCSTDCTPVT